MTDPLPDGTPHVAEIFEYRPVRQWCTQPVCMHGQVAVAADPNYRPNDTECTRYTCNENKLVTERVPACPMTDSGAVDGDADGDVTDGGVDAEIDSTLDGEVGDAPGPDVVDGDGA